MARSWVDTIIRQLNETVKEAEILGAYVYATVSTDTRHEQAQGLLSELRNSMRECRHCSLGSPTGSHRWVLTN